MSTTTSGDTGVDKVQSGAVISDTSIKGALNATGTAPIYACRAWVNFNGTGTVAIRGSGNVSSITDNGVGDYTMNFTTAMPDVNYSPIFMPVNDGSSFNGAGYYSNYIIYKNTTLLTTSIGVLVGYSNQSNASGKADKDVISVAVFR